MKKFLVFILTFMMVNVVNASNVPNLVGVTNKCYVVNNNRVSIPVKVYSTTDGKMTSLIDTYTLGFIDNQKDNIKVNLVIDDKDKNIAHIDNMYIDYNRDDEGRSLIKYSLEKYLNDFNLKAGEEYLSFILDIEFLKEVPNSYYLLGNDIVLGSDVTVCEAINEFKVTEVNTIKINKNGKYVIFFCLALICILVIIIFLFIKMKKIVGKK